MTRDEAIAEITRRLIEYYQPERIYLFGSVARGEDTPDSDLDFLVVVPDGIEADKMRGLHRPLSGLPVDADIIPWNKTDFDSRAAHVQASLPATVLREGRLLYDARTISV
jgi:predicted nucleotidyltransferase